MGTKMGPGYANLFVGFIEHQFISVDTTAPNLNFTAVTLTNTSALPQFITDANSFDPALKYTWAISDTSLAFLDIKISIEGNGLCTRCLLQTYRVTQLLVLFIFASITCQEFHTFFTVSQTSRSEAMWHFFDAVSVVQVGHHRAQQIDRQSALQTAEQENSDRIPFTLTFHPHNHAVKSIILKNFKLLQNDSETGTIFWQLPFRNIGNSFSQKFISTNDLKDRRASLF